MSGYSRSRPDKKGKSQRSGPVVASHDIPVQSPRSGRPSRKDDHYRAHDNSSRDNGYTSVHSTYSLYDDTTHNEMPNDNVGWQSKSGRSTPGSTSENTLLIHDNAELQKQIKQLQQEVRTLTAAQNGKYTHYNGQINSTDLTDSCNSLREQVRTEKRKVARLTNLYEEMESKNMQLERELKCTKQDLQMKEAQLISLDQMPGSRFSENVMMLTKLADELTSRIAILQPDHENEMKQMGAKVLHDSNRKHEQALRNKEKNFTDEVEKLKGYQNKYMTSLDNKTREAEDLKSSLLQSHGKISDLSSRLASEMGSKVATNESAIENVSIKVRPTTVSGEYSNLCSQEWLDAKTTIDKYTTKSEKEKLDFLCQVLLISEAKSMKKHEEIRNEIKNRLLHPLSTPGTIPDRVRESEDVLQRKKSHTPPARASSANRASTKTRSQKRDIPNQVTNVIGDFLRTTSEGIDLTPLISEIKKSLKSYAPDIVRNISIGGTENYKKPMEEYIMSSAELTWKMVNQRPQMKFSTDGINDKYNEHTQELVWDSADPNSKYSLVVCFAYPVLFHDRSLMAKGKVLLEKRQRQKMIKSSKFTGLTTQC